MAVSDLELSVHAAVTAVIIVKAGKVGAQMESLGNNPDETLSRTCP